VPQFSGTNATALKLGTCASIGYTVGPSGIQGIVWAPASLMGPVCSKQCGCSFNGASPGLPGCTDRADDPAAHRFCSLCGPDTACPGCISGTVTIRLYYPPSQREGNRMQ
jgi:hypothetical protein